MPWCLLRGEDDLVRPRGDVDLLVDAPKIGDVKQAVSPLGFVQLSAWGNASHRFFVAYVEEDDLWIKLDVVTELSFGPFQALRTGAAVECLRSREHHGPTAKLAVANAFNALLLHCLIDRGDVPPRHASRLVRLAPQATDGALAAAVHDLWPPEWDERRVLNAAEQELWDELLAAGRELRRRWARRRLLATVWRISSQATLRQLGRVQTAIHGRGTLVTLLGPDGAGKSTLAAGLAAGILLPVRVFYVGLYALGDQRPRWMLVRLTTRLLWLLRTSLAIEYHLLRGRVVVTDRHSVEALLGLEAESRKSARVRLWILARATPAPDVVLLLDAPAETMFKRKGEHGIDVLERQRRQFRALAARLSGVVVLDAAQDSERVRRRAINVVWNHRARRRGSIQETAANKNPPTTQK